MDVCTSNSDITVEKKVSFTYEWSREIMVKGYLAWAVLHVDVVAYNWREITFTKTASIAGFMM